MDESGITRRVSELLDQSGLSQKDFAQRIGIDGSKLTKSLSGKRRFTSLEFALIAEVGSTTVDWILNGGVVRDLEFAHRAADHVFESGDLVGREAVELIAERRAGLEYLGHSQRLPRLPAVPEGKYWVKYAASLASKFVSFLGERLGELSNLQLIGAIESKLGIDVVVVGLPEGCDGLSYEDNEVRCIVLGATDAPFRQRYTLAHELAHIALGDAKNEVIEEGLYSDRSECESRANVFAANFLAPRAEIVEVLAGRTAGAAFDDLVLHFQMSPDAMSWRLLNEELIDKAQQQNLGRETARTIAMRAGRAAEHTKRARETSMPRPAQALVDAYLDAYRDGKTTLRPAASLLGVSTESLEVYFENDSSADDGDQMAFGG